MRPIVDALGAHPSADSTWPAVAAICPTLDRPDTHAALYAGFCAQSYPDKHLYVLDESAQRSAFFGTVSDPRVTYVHAPSARGEVTRIGAARNRLIGMTREPIIWHVDDDDLYSPAFLRVMIGKLGSGDIAKLVVWNSVLPDGSVYQWDTRKMGGQHFAIRGGEAPAVVDVGPGEGDATFADAMLNGFGFSMVYRRAAWERRPFPDEGTEDYEWMRAQRHLGAKIVHVPDFAQGVLHTVHERSASMIFPQVMLGSRRSIGIGASGAHVATLPPPRSLTDAARGLARTAMLGFADGLTQLPTGKPIVLRPGVRYSVLAAVKDKHSLKALAARCATWGVKVQGARDHVDPAEYGVARPPGGYRLVHVTATSETSATMPWSVPKPLSWFDKSTVVRAWSSVPQIGAQPAPSMVASLEAARRVGRCATCRNYAISPEMGPMVKDSEGWPHHPACRWVRPQIGAVVGSMSMLASSRPMFAAPGARRAAMIGATIFDGWETQEVVDATDQQIGGIVAALALTVATCTALTPAQLSAWQTIVDTYNTATLHLKDVEGASVIEWDPVAKLIEYKIIVDQLNALRPELDTWNGIVSTACKTTPLVIPGKVAPGGSDAGNSLPGMGPEMPGWLKGALWLVGIGGTLYVLHETHVLELAAAGVDKVTKRGGARALEAMDRARSISAWRPR